MYRSSPLRSTLSTGYITGLDMCKVCAEAVHCAALWTCVQVQKNVIIPTPPHPTLSHVMCARVTLGGKKDAKLCLCVLVTPVCVRGWLWKMAVCARDSSLCADSGWKKWCKIVPVCTCDSRVCARVTPWPTLNLLSSLPQWPFLAASSAFRSSPLHQPTSAAIFNSLQTWWPTCYCECRWPTN